jgi:hypothetical protein
MVLDTDLAVAATAINGGAEIIHEYIDHEAVEEVTYFLPSSTPTGKWPPLTISWFRTPGVVSTNSPPPNQRSHEADSQPEVRDAMS